MVYHENKMISNILSDELNENFRNISNKNLLMDYELKSKINCEEFLNEIEIMKINENLRKDTKFIKLKNKISKIKHHSK